MSKSEEIINKLFDARFITTKKYLVESYLRKGNTTEVCLISTLGNKVRFRVSNNLELPTVL